MADFTFPTLTTAIVGVDTSVIYELGATNYTINPSPTDIKVNFGLGINSTIPGWLTGRRPVSGQVFPRGVYNK